MFGAGCVVGLHMRQERASTRSFIAGVLTWVATSPPTAEALRGATIERYGFAHIKSITTTGGEILGVASISFGSAPESAGDFSLEGWGFNVARVVAQRLARERLELYIRALPSGGEDAV